MSDLSEFGMNDFRDEEDVAEAILGYLSEHPRAMDTLEGIAEWWLVRQQIRVHVAMLRRVLRRLTDEGLLEEIGAGLYRRCRRKY
jgi:hypothetical protein